MDFTETAESLGFDLTLAFQDGLITRQQCLRVGFSLRQIEQRVTDGRWQRVLPAVYRVPGAVNPYPDLEERVRLRAAWIWAGPRAVLGSRTAAWWLGMVPRAPAKVEIWVPAGCRVRSASGIEVRRRNLPEVDVREHLGLLTTSRLRTAVDLAAAGSTDGLDFLARERKLTPERMAEVVARGRGTRGWTQARKLVAGSSSNPWSVPERDLHAALIQAGITEWVANTTIHVGGKPVTPDIRLLDSPLVIEVDGRSFHATVGAFEKDHRRDARYVAAGWTVLRFTFWQVKTDLPWVIDCIQQARTRLKGTPVPEIEPQPPEKSPAATADSSPTARSPSTPPAVE